MSESRSRSDARRRVTIHDVAVAAGVSPATVSRILNSQGRASDATRQRVQEAASRLNYRPNLNAQSLRARTSSLVGVVVPDIANTYFMSLVRGCEDVAQPAGLSVIVASTDENPAKERRHVESMLDHGVNHLVLAPANEEAGALDVLEEHPVSCVLVDRDIPTAPYGAVLNDDLTAIGELIGLLVGGGHREIGIVAGPQGAYTGRVRLQAARQALADLRIPLPDVHVVVGNFMDDLAYAGVLSLLQARPRPTAVLACNNIMTAGVIRAARLLGLAIPEDLSVVGISDVHFLDLVQPPVTIAQQDPQTIGRLAMEMMLRDPGLGTDSRRVHVPAPIVRGGSVRTLAATAPAAR